MIGLFGGTFDPIHNGHLQTTLEVAESLGLEQIRLIPGHIPPHRPQPTASPEERLALVKLATAMHPLFVEDDFELTQTGTSYTIETLKHFKKTHVRLCFLMGADAFANFRTWHQWEAILALCHLVVMSRPDPNGKLDTTINDNQWYQNRITTQLSDLHTKPAGCIWFHAVTPLSISATLIRQRFKQQLSNVYLLPDSVNQYCLEQAIYSKDD